MIYFIRHARSVYNEREAKLAQSFQELNQHEFEQTAQWLQFKFDWSHEDCGIFEEIAKAQCEECRQKLKDVQLDLVIVSPMRRALSTCALILRDHRSRAPVIVDPAFREILESSCDIGSKLRLSMKEYPDFDYSLIDNIDCWYIETLTDQLKRKQLTDMLRDIAPESMNQVAKEVMLSYLKQLWESRQTQPEFKLHALPSVEVQKTKLRLLLEKYKSIAVITHSQNIKSYVGIKPPNCSILLYKPEYLNLPVDKIPHNFL